MSNISSLKPFAKGDDVRRKVNARKGTGAKDKLKKMVEEIEEQMDDLSDQEIADRIFKKLAAQAMCGDIESVKLLSAIKKPVRTKKAAAALEEISRKKISDRSKAILDKFAKGEIASADISTYSAVLKTAIDTDFDERLKIIDERLDKCQKHQEGK